eukprot:GHVN01043836.1.p1 GENE.GHVN01043836.1~~GHVN01043836.1.p1  ORF type:complete len:186 (-),score=22.93 GHVN01043836.1:171-728(-)
MGIDLHKECRGRVRKTGRRHAVSKNPYINLLAQLYKFLTRRTDSRVNKLIYKRLITPIRCRGPISIRRVTKLMKGKEGKICVIVGTVTEDQRLYEMPKLSIAALRFSESARRRVLAAGGECITLDEFAMRNPKATDVVLLKGHTETREANQHFGIAPGCPGSHAAPYRAHRKKERGPGHRCKSRK